uniref:MYM-type domain-containing protein n=1 Tax=viral metagenome TaxID=1070528 RepID=A0A6C0C5A1_9ZZZZ
MEQPKKRGRKVGSKNNKNNNVVKGPPKKRGRKPNKKVITNDNPVFANDNLNIDDLIIKLNNDKKDNNLNLSLVIEENKDINYSNNERNSQLCWNCCHSFHSVVHGLPINYNNDVFHTIGDFCSVECMSRYAVDNMNDDIYEILPLINMYNNKINNCNKKVKLAPNKLLLTIFGGNMTIDEYRNDNTMYDIKMPIIIPVNYNINQYNLKNNNNLSDLKLYRKKKVENNNSISNKLNIKNI